MAVDAAEAASFYGGLFGWECNDVFTLDGRAVAGLRPGAPGRPAGWLTHLSVQDIDASTASIAAAGGTVLLPPTDIGARGRTAMCADSQGAIFALWQRGSFGGAELINEPATMCWSEVMARDPEAASSFYGEAFGWQDRPGEIAEGMPYTEWMSAGRVVAGMVVMDERFPAQVPAHWRTTFEVADCTEITKRCTELGGQVVLGPIDVVVGMYAQIVDPQGGSFGVIELIESLREGW
jgi:hypothetical protein